MTPVMGLDVSDRHPGDGGVSRRHETAEDAPFRLRLFRESHGGILAGLDPALIDMLVRQQVAAQATAYAATYPNARSEIIEHDRLPIGRMVVDRTIEILTLVDIALLEAWRGLGIGGRLLARLLREAEDAGAAVQLSVALDNPARRLYARLGFATIGMTATHAAMRWDPARSAHLLSTDPNGPTPHPGRSVTGYPGPVFSR